MLMPGAVRGDVKGLAMGAARSKGWTIVKSTEDRLVVQRPVDPGSSAAAALGASASTIPPVIEVTSAFVQRSDGVLVGLGAELVSQPPGEKTPKRMDYTETYRDALTRSLESLRSNWAANRQRVAGSTPSEAVRAEGEAERAETGEASTNPLVQAWADTLEEEKASKGISTTGAGAAASSGPTPSQAQLGPAPEPRVASMPPTPTPTPLAPVSPQPTPTPVTAPSAAAPIRTSGPAPVVEGNVALRGGPSSAQIPSTQLPPAAEESVPYDQNMLTLNQASGAGTWAYYAEQYARLRGCDVTDQGAVLIESRSDSEIHKVPCASADSFLVKCQAGVCRGLE
jgi:hypothetical protein